MAGVISDAIRGWRSSPILGFYVLTRVALLGLMLVSLVFPVNGGPIRDIIIVPHDPVANASPELLRGFANWDADHYVQIAGTGYSGDLGGFFPLFPLLVKIVSLGHPALMVVAGLLINFVAGAIAMVFLARLLAIDDRMTTFPAGVVLLLYPGVVFLSVPYSEALALAALLASAYFARRGRWWPAGLAGILAAMSRPTGVMAIVLLAVEYLQQSQWRLPKLSRLARDLPALVLPVLGVLAFALYLGYATGDPLGFIHHQQERTIAGVPIEVTSGRLLTSPSVWLWVLAMALALASIRWLRVSYGVFAVAVLLAVPLTGAFGASLRYAVVAWPIFVLVGKWLGHGPRLTAVASVLALGLAFCGLLFVHGYWVS